MKMMSFREFDWLFLNFTDKLNRKRLWGMVFPVWFFGLMISFVLDKALNTPQVAVDAFTRFDYQAIGTVYFCLSPIIWMAPAWKRWHDRGRSGWWSVLLLPMPLFDLIVMDADLLVAIDNLGVFGTVIFSVLISIEALAVIAFFWVIVQVFFLGSKIEGNAYGEAF